VPAALGLASALLAAAACGPADASRPSPLGRGWALVAAPSAGSPERQCANRTEWTANVRPAAGGSVEAVKSDAFGRPGPAPALPFPVASDIKAGGPVLAKPVADGYLVGFNHGEFGGAVWWYDPTGKSRRRLGDARPVGFVDIALPGRNVVAGIVEGLAHLDQDAGSVAVVERDVTGALALKRLRELPSAPQAVGVPGPSGTLVATLSEVVRIERDGTVRTIVSIDMQGLYPQSIVEAATGSIFVGMRRYVVEIEPRTLSARISWYTDSACRVFRPVDRAACECR
jgi:hypothetical protein